MGGGSCGTTRAQQSKPQFPKFPPTPCKQNTIRNKTCPKSQHVHNVQRVRISPKLNSSANPKFQNQKHKVQNFQTFRITPNYPSIQNTNKHNTSCSQARSARNIRKLQNTDLSKQVQTSPKTALRAFAAIGSACGIWYPWRWAAAVASDVKEARNSRGGMAFSRGRDTQPLCCSTALLQHGLIPHPYTDVGSSRAVLPFFSLASRPDPVRPLQH